MVSGNTSNGGISQTDNWADLVDYLLGSDTEMADFSQNSATFGHIGAGDPTADLRHDLPPELAVRLDSLVAAIAAEDLAAAPAAPESLPLPGYLSGNLDAAARARVDAFLAADPDLRDDLIAAVTQLRKIDAVATPAPASLIASAKALAPEMAPAKSARGGWWLFGGRSIPASAAMAYGLVAVVALGAVTYGSLEIYRDEEPALSQAPAIFEAADADQAPAMRDLARTSKSNDETQATARESVENLAASQPEAPAALADEAADGFSRQVAGSGGGGTVPAESVTAEQDLAVARIDAVEAEESDAPGALGNAQTDSAFRSSPPESETLGQRSSDSVAQSRIDEARDRQSPIIQQEPAFADRLQGSVTFENPARETQTEPESQIATADVAAEPVDPAPTVQARGEALSLPSAEPLEDQMAMPMSDPNSQPLPAAAPPPSNLADAGSESEFDPIDLAGNLAAAPAAAVPDRGDSEAAPILLATTQDRQASPPPPTFALRRQPSTELRARRDTAVAASADPSVPAIELLIRADADLVEAIARYADTGSADARASMVAAIKTAAPATNVGPLSTIIVDRRLAQPATATGIIFARLDRVIVYDDGSVKWGDGISWQPRAGELVPEPRSLITNQE